MSKDSYSEPRGRVTTRTLVIPAIVAVASMVVVLYLRISPGWNTSHSSSIITAVLPIVLMWIFFASVLIILADLREMQGTISGWFDVLGLMAVEGLLAYLVFARLLYVGVVIALCVLFVIYANFAQSD